MDSVNTKGNARVDLEDRPEKAWVGIVPQP